MWPKIRDLKIRNSTHISSSIFAQLLNFSQPVLISAFADAKQQIRNKPQKSFNVNDEYICALRTKSYVEFFIKAQSVIEESSPPSTSSSTGRRRRRKLSETILLEPSQEAIPSILESPFLLMLPDLKSLLIDYFNVSAEASKFCTRLLEDVELTRSNSRSIQKSLDSIENCSSPETIETIASEFLALREPFSDPDKHDFALIHDDYEAVSRRLNCTRKKVARKIKSIEIIETISCGLVAITARTLTELFRFPPESFRRKLLRYQMIRNGGLGEVGEQLEAAAKGSYILNREFDTTSRLVARLDDAMDHGKAMARLFVERKEDKFAVQVAMDELKKSNLRLRNQVEEVEEHLYLCIVTINRARGLVINQIQMKSHP